MSAKWQRICFTSYDRDGEILRKPIFKPLMKYLVYQIESCPTTGKEHVQGYAEFTSQLRLKAIKDLFGSATMHVEKAMGTCEENKVYCTKSETRIEGPWEFGEPGKQGKRTDLDAVHQAISEGADEAKIAEEHFNVYAKYHGGITKAIALRQKARSWVTEVYYLWGKTGSGKTRYVHEKHVDEAIWIWDGNPRFFSGYTGQEVALFDDFDETAFKAIGRSRWLQLTDRYAQRVEIKGGSVQWAPKIIYVTSNYDPQRVFGGTSMDMFVDAVYRRITSVLQFPLGNVSCTVDNDSVGGERDGGGDGGESKGGGDDSKRFKPAGEVVAACVASFVRPVDKSCQFVEVFPVKQVAVK